MYSSPKFFVPSVIAGFGPDPVVVGALVLLPPPPPQAVRPIRSATPKEIANAALAARRVCLRNIGCPPPWLALSGPVLRETLRSRSHPTRRRALNERQDKCGRQRHRRDAQRGGEHAGIVVEGLIVDDLAEAAATGNSRDRRGRDHEHGGNPNPGEEKRQAERQLNACEDLSLAETHPPGCLDDVPVDALDGEVGIGEDRRDAEDDECHGVVPEPDTEPRDEDSDERDARERAADRGCAECEE